jgi:hypothetical protein
VGRDRPCTTVTSVPEGRARLREALGELARTRASARAARTS